MMNKKIFLIVIGSSLIETILLIIYSYLQNNLIKDIDPAFRMFCFLILSIFIAIITMKIITKFKGYQTKYIKSFIIIFLTLYPTAILTRIYWGLLKNNFDTVKFTLKPHLIYLTFIF